MEKLMISFSELESVSKNISSKNNDLIELIKKISGMNTRLLTYWEGEDAQKYSNVASDLLKNMNELTDIIAYISLHLDFSSNAIKETMDHNLKMLK